MNSASTPGAGWPVFVVRGLALALAWWLLTDGEASSWWIGVPAVVAAVLASAVLIPPVALVWGELLRFVPAFLARSLLGGLDVAWRAFHPRLPIAPALIEYPLRLAPGLPQVFLVNTISLLPGTLSAELDQNILRVHVLDGRKDPVAELAAFEHRVARLYGICLDLDSGGA